jgi:hypothetical protein
VHFHDGLSTTTGGVGMSFSRDKPIAAEALGFGPIGRWLNHSHRFAGKLTSHEQDE